MEENRLMRAIYRMTTQVNYINLSGVILLDLLLSGAAEPTAWKVLLAMVLFVGGVCASAFLRNETNISVVLVLSLTFLKLFTTSLVEWNDVILLWIFVALYYFERVLRQKGGMNK